MEMNLYVKKIGQNIKAFRKAKNFTQAQLASEAEMSTSFFQKIENGVTTSPNVITLIKISTVLEIPFEFLFFGTGITLLEKGLNKELLLQMAEGKSDFHFFSQDITELYQGSLLTRRESRQ